METQVSIAVPSPRHHKVLVVLLGLVGISCSDSGIKVHNNRPEVVITSPVHGDCFSTSEPLVLQAALDDDQGDPQDLQLSWRVGADSYATTADDQGVARLVLEVAENGTTRRT